jgi:hypothetical protein
VVVQLVYAGLVGLDRAGVWNVRHAGDFVGPHAACIGNGGRNVGGIVWPISPAATLVSDIDRDSIPERLAPLGNEDDEAREPLELVSQRAVRVEQILRRAGVPNMRQPGNPAFVPLPLVDHENKWLFQSEMLVHMLTIC